MKRIIIICENSKLESRREYTYNNKARQMETHLYGVDCSAESITSETIKFSSGALVDTLDFDFHGEESFRLQQNQ